MFKKRYKIEYWLGDRSKPSYLIQLSKSGRNDGVRISFYNDGEKYWQDKCKNDLLNGLDKVCFGDSINLYFHNWKKNKTQGIKIYFK